LDPTSMSPGSIMPPYPWLYEQEWDKELTPAKIRAMQTLGVPYPEGFDQQAVADAENQAALISKGLELEGIKMSSDAEIIALIAYLQRLGTDIKNVEGVAEGN
ncbi:MAG: cbb3-type cytochrome c oxidase subunit II, partial [Pseudomonadales bacterium]